MLAAGYSRIEPSGKPVLTMSTHSFRRLALIGLIAVLAVPHGLAADSFRVKTADKYPAKQKQDDLIVAVKAFVSDKDQKEAFGNTRPFKHGVAPLLLVISNRGTNTYSLENLKVRLITRDREGLEPISGEELGTFNPKGHQPTRRQIPGVPGLSRTRVKKGPLNRPEITQNEFLAPIVAPKSTASGFLYYWVGAGEALAGASAYISGVYDITNGRDLFYFEIPLGKGR